LSQNRQTLTEFFKEEGMETDFSISQFDFTKAMNTLVRSMNILFEISNHLYYLDLNDDDLFRLINEMDDKNTKKISIRKFQDVYDAIARDAPNRGDSSPASIENSFRIHLTLS